MAMKTTKAKEPEFVPEVPSDSDLEGSFNGDISLESDFDLESEFKPNPLIPQGTYLANVTDVKFDHDQQSIVFQFTLQDNGGYMSDGSTPVDGANVFSRIFLPRPGDEDNLTKDGRMNKRQAKINMMKQFADSLKIQMNTAKDIMDGLQNGEWIGIAAKLNVTTREYEGRVFNDVKKVSAA